MQASEEREEGEKEGEHESHKGVPNGIYKREVRRVGGSRERESERGGGGERVRETERCEEDGEGGFS